MTTGGDDDDDDDDDMRPQPQPADAVSTAMPRQWEGLAPLILLAFLLYSSTIISYYIDVIINTFRYVYVLLHKLFYCYY